MALAGLISGFANFWYIRIPLLHHILYLLPLVAWGAIFCGFDQQWSLAPWVASGWFYAASGLLVLFCFAALIGKVSNAIDGRTFLAHGLGAVILLVAVEPYFQGPWDPDTLLTPVISQQDRYRLEACQRDLRLLSQQPWVFPLYGITFGQDSFCTILSGFYAENPQLAFRLDLRISSSWEDPPEKGFLVLDIIANN